MIISKTPFRISLFGGGTDYPSWYRQHCGQVISTTINKFCYVSVRHYPPFFPHRFRLSYSRQENCASIADIQHPAIRETLRYLNWKDNDGLEINQIGDLPARTGLGTSSAFVVGLLKALYCLQGRTIPKNMLTEQSIYIEQDLLNEVVGSQDQTASAYGGFNKILFRSNGNIVVLPLNFSSDVTCGLNDRLQLYYTGIQRTASDIAKGYMADITKKTETILKELGRMVDDAIKYIANNDWEMLGWLLHHSWILKRELNASISNSFMDNMYIKAKSAGAFGGKILGAGGGGFLLLLVPPEKQPNVRDALKDFALVPFKFDTGGSLIILSDNEPDFK